MELSRWGHWSGLLCPPPGDLSHLEIELGSPALWVDTLLPESPRKPRDSKMFQMYRKSEEPRPRTEASNSFSGRKAKKYTQVAYLSGLSFLLLTVEKPKFALKCCCDFGSLIKYLVPSPAPCLCSGNRSHVFLSFCLLLLLSLLLLLLFLLLLLLSPLLPPLLLPLLLLL